MSRHSDDQPEVAKPNDQAIPTLDLSALSRSDREVIVRFEAALLGVPPTPASDEAAAIAAMNRFVQALDAKSDAVRHWYYPSSIIGCGLCIDDLCSSELACLRSEVTCLGCLAQLQADRKICEACRLGAPESGHPAPPHVCDRGGQAR
jgi:hypothetical protein